MIRDALVGLLEGVPPWLAVLLLAAIPIVELRGAIPVAILVYDMAVAPAVFWAVAGNLLPIVFLLAWLGPVERYLRRFGAFDRFFTRLFDRTVRRLDESVKRYEAFALTIFVAIPLPVTGGWTGSAAAHVFQLGYWRSLGAITLGVLFAAAIVTALTLTGSALF